MYNLLLTTILNEDKTKILEVALLGGGEESSEIAFDFIALLMCQLNIFNYANKAKKRRSTHEI